MPASRSATPPSTRRSRASSPTRPVNAGDVVAPGTELYTIVDPSSIQLEASVPSESLSLVRVGAEVIFEVRGYPDQTFNGKVERISPTADPTTRQVPIWVTVDNRSGRLVAGLFADGRVTQAARKGLIVPSSVVSDIASQPSVLRIKDGKVERVSVRTGLVDAQNERVEVVDGLAEGDVLLTGVAQGVTPGTQVKVIDRSQAAEAGAASSGAPAGPQVVAVSEVRGLLAIRAGAGCQVCIPVAGVRFPVPGRT